MGLIADAVRNFIGPPPTGVAGTTAIWQTPMTGGAQTYANLARKGYAGNEIVFSAIELLATSAAEPHIIGRRWRRDSPRFVGMTNIEIKDCIRIEAGDLVARGLSFREVDRRLIQNGFIIQVPNHPLVRILNAPNPFASRGQFWSTSVMDRYLGGNFYGFKARYRDGPLNGAIGELWRLRPDRVRIIPDKETFCKYQYTIPGQAPIIYEYKDIFHWKTRNPLDDYYGMPPLMAFVGRMDIDSYMQGFLKSFFEKGGTGPGGILTSKAKLSQEQKDYIREQKQRRFGGPSGWHEWMIIDSTETTYQSLGLNRGLRDALPKEIDAQNEARLSMAFGIPGSILGTLIGYESSSYANKRQDRETLWKVVMAPLLSDLDDVLNLSLVPEFGGIDEVMFSLADIEALQEEVDKLHERHRKDVAAGLESWEEGRDALGLDPNDISGTFLIPVNILPTRGETLSEERPPMPVEALRALMAPPAIEGPKTVAEARCPKCGHKEGEQVNVGAELHCRKCREPFLVEA